MKNSFFLCLSAIIVAMDQLTKLLVTSRMHLFESIPVLDNIISFTYIRNKGVAFGMLSASDGAILRAVLTLVTFLAILLVVYFLLRTGPDTPIRKLALSLILGGAVGNFIDRVRLGEVVDFVDIHWGNLHWPAFNVADSSITIGVIVLLFCLAFERSRERGET